MCVCGLIGSAKLQVGVCCVFVCVCVCVRVSCVYACVCMCGLAVGCSNLDSPTLPLLPLNTHRPHWSQSSCSTSPASTAARTDTSPTSQKPTPPPPTTQQQLKALLLLPLSLFQTETPQLLSPSQTVQQTPTQQTLLNPTTATSAAAPGLRSGCAVPRLTRCLVLNTL